MSIAGSLGGGTLCDGSSGSQQCVANPAQAVTSPLGLRPAWVSDAPIAVAAGKKYRFSTFVIQPSRNPDDGVEGEGAATRVRWLGANGQVLSTVDGPSLVNRPSAPWAGSRSAATWRPPRARAARSCCSATPTSRPPASSSATTW